MSALPEDRCPRCGGSFHCGIGDAGPCACTTIRLDAALQRQLRERYTGCLCLRCLGELAAGSAFDTPQDATSFRSALGVEPDHGAN